MVDVKSISLPNILALLFSESSLVFAFCREHLLSNGGGGGGGGGGVATSVSMFTFNPPISAGISTFSTEV